jgi:DNA repair protein RecO (recombination protein O)
MEPAYVLHHRPYRETSQLLEAIGRNHGRVGLVARGARGPRARWRSCLQPFQPLHLSWSGRGGLFTLTDAEPAAPPLSLSGDRLLSAWYLNELLLAFTTRGDPHPELFVHYAAALSGLQELAEPEMALRRFELALLGEVGYGLNLEAEARSGLPLEAEQLYSYIADTGAVAVAVAEPRPGYAYSGAQLQRIATGEFAVDGDLVAAKRLLRSILAHYLGDRPLKTRRVLAAMHR